MRKMRKKAWGVLLLVGWLCAGLVMGCVVEGSTPGGRVTLTIDRAGLLVEGTLSVTITAGENVQVQQNLTLDGAGAASFSFELNSGAYTMQASFTPSTGIKPTHEGTANFNVTQGANSVFLALKSVKKTVSVQVAIEEKAPGMPASIEGVIVTPAKEVYGGEYVTLEVKGGDSSLSYSWQASPSLHLENNAGPKTSFYAPAKLGDTWVTLHVSTAAGPASMKIALKVVSGGRPATSTSMASKWLADIARLEDGRFRMLTLFKPSGQIYRGFQLFALDQPTLTIDNTEGAAETGTASMVWSGRYHGVLCSRNDPGQFGGTRFYAYRPTHTSATPMSLVAGGYSRTSYKLNDIAASHTAIAWSADRFGLFWSQPDNSMYYPTRLRMMTLKLDEKRQLQLSTQLEHDAHGIDEKSLAITGGQNEFALVWTDAGKTIFARMDLNGQWLGSSGGTSITSALVTTSFPDVAWDGNDYAVVWVEGSHLKIFSLKLATLSATGAVQKIHTVTAGTASISDAKLVWTGKEYAVTWVQMLHGYPEVMLRRMPKTGQSRPPIRLSAALYDKQDLRLQHNGTELVVGWTQSQRSGDPSVEVLRVPDPN